MSSRANAIVARLTLFATVMLTSVAAIGAGTFVAFGPVDFVRATGQPTAELVNFSIANPDTDYTLRIDNGGLDDEFDRVSSAVVLLNGVEIAGPSDFNQNVNIIERLVTLVADNELSVEVRSKPGSGLTIQIIGIDDDPPSINALIDPAPNADGWNSTDVTVSFDCSDATSGIETCTDPIIVTAEGAGQVITGTAVDRAGNSASTSATINIDKTAPDIFITSPIDGSTFSGADVTVLGQVSDALSGIDSVLCNGATVPITDSSFTCDVTLIEGTNLIEAIATDIARNSATTNVQVVFVPPPTPLDLTITEPADGAFINQLTVIVRGTVSDSDARVLVQGRSADVSGNTFQAETSLFEGPNVISVQGRSPAGADATASISVTVDTIPPALAVTSPPDRSIAIDSPVTVSGSVFDVSAVTCSINGVAATIDQSVINGTTNLADGSNFISVDCEDAAGNATSLQRTVYLDATPMLVASVEPADGAVSVLGATPVTVTFSEAADPASINDTSVYLSAGAAILSADVAVSPDGLSATLTTVTPLPSGMTVSFNVTTGVTNSDSIPLAVPFSSGFTIAGAPDDAGAAIGQVFDDVRGMPVANATVEAIALGDGSVLASGVTDERGRYLLTPGQSNIVIRVSAPGFTNADRLPGPPQGDFVDVFDARLTPLAEPTIVEAVLGGEIINEAENLLRIAPGALSTDSDIRFTAISEQGPQAPFPIGWAPIGIAAVDTPSPFNLPATLVFNNLDENLVGRNAVFAVYDATSVSWIALENHALTGSGTIDVGGVTGSGQFALVVADTGTGAPDPGVPSQPLTAGTAIPIPANAIAIGTVEPAVGRGDDPTPAAAAVTITANEILRSGSVIRGDFMEVFLLRDGDRVTPFDRSQDLIVYRSPDIAAAETQVAAKFPVAPSQTFALAELSEGTVTVSLLRDEVVATNVIGTNGGGIQIDDGSRVSISAGSLPIEVPVNLRRLGEASFPIVSAPDITFIGGLELDLSGAQTSAPVTLSLAGAAALVPTGSQVVVAEMRTIRDRQELVLVAVGIIQGDSITTATTFGGATLPGIRNGGRYGFYRFDGVLDIVEGIARDEAGRRDGHVIEIEALPFLSITDINGAFALVSVPGIYTVIAKGAVIADQVRVAGNTATALSEIVITATPPEVESITVKRPPVAGNFAGPLALLGVPAPVIDDSVGGNGNGQIEAGETIALSISVRNDGTIAMQDGSIAIQIDGPDGRIDTSPPNITFDNLPPNEPFTIGPLVFSVPGNVDPALIKYTLIHSNAGGFANVIPFDLPFDVEHPRVPVGSEITVQFSEPVTDANLNGSITLDHEDPTGPVPTPTNVIVSADRTTATVRPLAELADDEIYSITLTDAIVDDDGRPLADAPVVQRLSTEDLTPPPQLAPGQIEASVPDANGFVTITGSPGTVNPDDIVIVLNQTTGVTVLATVNPDGSFMALISAEVTDLITIIVRDRNNNETTIDITDFVNRDPTTGEVISTVIGRRGGTITGPGNIQLTVPTGALIGATELSVTPVADPFELPADLAGDPAVVAAFNSLFSIAGRVQIDADSTTFAGPIGLSLPAPAGSNVGDLFLITHSQTVTIGGPLADLDRITGLTAEQNPIRTVERLEIVETATVKDVGGELVLSTDSPPFPGITNPGTFTIVGVSHYLTFIAGEVRRNSEDGVPVPDALVRSMPDALETSVFATRTDRDGHFVVADIVDGEPFAPGDIVSSRLDVRDTEFERVIRRDVRGTVERPNPPGTVIVVLDEVFVLPAPLPEQFTEILGDLEPPEVEIEISPFAARGPGFVHFGARLTIEIQAIDNDVVEFIGLEVDQGLGFEVLAPTPGIDEPVGDSVPPTITETFEFNAFTQGLITFRGQARDRSGNTTFVDTRILVFTGNDPVGPCQLLDTMCATTIDGDFEVRFTNKLNSGTIDSNAVTVTELDGDEVRSRNSLQNEDFGIRVSPRRNLRLGAQYVVTTQGIEDTTGQQCPAISFLCPIPEEINDEPIIIPPDATEEPQDQPADAKSVPYFIALMDNVEDVVVTRQSVLAVNHPSSAAIGDNGQIHNFQLNTDEMGQVVSVLKAGINDTVGRPLSLAVDGHRAYVGNRFLGPIVIKEPIVTTFVPGTISSQPDNILGCSPLGVSGSPTGCTGIDLIESSFPNPPSNLEVFDILNPADPDRLGGVVTNSIPPDIWDPNTWPHRVEKTKQGIGILHFLGNIELFTRSDQPESTINIGPIRRYGEATAEAEFTDAAYFDGFAIVLSGGVPQLISTLGANDPLRQEMIVSSGPALPISDGFAVGAVPAFRWTDDADQSHISDLAFITTRDNQLRIFDVTDPATAFPRGSLANTFGNMSFDDCRGIAYLHGLDGAFHIVDFNDPNDPVELNRLPTGDPAISVPQLGPKPSFNGNSNNGGIVALAGSAGMGILQIELSANVKFPEREQCAPRIVNPTPPTEAFGRIGITTPATDANSQTGNEFTYTADTSTLRVPVRVDLSSFGPDAIDEFEDRVQINISDIVDSNSVQFGGEVSLAWDQVVEGDWKTGLAQYNPITQLWEATATFTGLPRDNSEFGVKIVTVELMEDETPIFTITANFEIFWPLLQDPMDTSSTWANNHPDFPGTADLGTFSATVNDHPRRQNEGDSSRSPNWFYYWIQTPAGDPNDVHANNSGSTYKDGDPNARFDSTLARECELGRLKFDATGEAPAIAEYRVGANNFYTGDVARIFVYYRGLDRKTVPGVTPNTNCNGSGLLRTFPLTPPSGVVLRSPLDGGAPVNSGIDAFAATIAHEQVHVRQATEHNMLVPAGSRWSWNIPPKNPDLTNDPDWNHDPGGINLDPDADDISDAPQISAPDPRPSISDKQLVGALSAEFGLLAGWTSANGISLLELQALPAELAINNDDFLEHDWGSPGKQHGTPRKDSNGRVFNSYRN